MLGHLDHGKRVKSGKLGPLFAKNSMAMHQIYFVQVIHREWNTIVPDCLNQSSALGMNTTLGYGSCLGCS
jgi:hypothetical protein